MQREMFFLKTQDCGILSTFKNRLELRAGQAKLSFAQNEVAMHSSNGSR